MKKIAIVCCVLLVAAALVTGSIAYFTDSVESNSNVLAAGNLDIVQHEYEDVNRDTGALTVWQEDGAHPVYPCGIQAADLDETDERISLTINEKAASLYNKQIPGFIDKVVNVENVGTLITYVRTFVAVPVCVAQESWYEWLHPDLNGDGTWAWGDPFLDRINDQDHLIYEGIYTAQLMPGEFTTPSLLGFYMDGKVGNDGDTLVYKADDGKKYPLMDTRSQLEILVKSEASQAIVFDDANQALTVTFEGEEIENYHPWMKK